ncbi:putative integral membrane protein [Cryptosporidium felis]|nr:putative integral membrane protein [Cryptosporidium felis]
MVDIVNNDNKRHSGSHHRKRHEPKNSLAFNEVHDDATSQMVDTQMRDMSMQNSPNGYDGDHESEVDHEGLQGLDNSMDHEGVDPESGVVHDDAEE